MIGKKFGTSMSVELKLFKGIIPIVNSHQAMKFIDFITQSNPIKVVSDLVTLNDGKPLVQLQSALLVDVSIRFINGSFKKLLMFLHDNRSLIEGERQNYFYRVLYEIFNCQSLLEFVTENFMKIQDSYLVGWLILELLKSGQEIYASVKNSEETLRLGNLLGSSIDEKSKRIGNSILNMLNDVPNDLLTVNENQKYSYSEFRSMSAAPSISDLKDLPVVPKSVFTGPEKDKKLEDNRYLDWQYRILREDVHGTIREEWLCYLNPKTPSEKKIASKLRARTFIVEDILGVSYNTKKRHPVHMKIKLSQPKFNTKNMKENKKKLLKKYWDENQRLLTVDSLVALVKGKNLLCIGSVLDRSELSAKNVVRVYFFQTSDILKLCNFTIDNETKDVRLVQFSASFFAYKPFLEKLRTLSDVPFPDEIIHSVSRHVENNDFLHPIIEFIKTSDLNMQELDCMNLKKPIILNEKQREAVVNSFSMKMSLIQGPPGTGKSYCGTIIAKIALLDPRCKVLCVCYTNHALDQYLENLLDIGVSENDIVRIGFAKVSDRVKSCSLFESRNRKSYDPSFNRQYASLMSLSDSQENAVSSKYSRHINLTEKNAKNQYWTFKNYLNIVNPEISDVFKEPDVGNGNFMMIAKDGKKLNGRHLWEYWIDGMSLDEVYKFYSDEMSMETMKVWCMNGEKRLELLRSWINEINNEFELDFGNKILEYNNTIEMLKELCGESDIREIRSKRIMGCTTTGAAKNSHLVEAFDANVLILEEAGEVLESHVVTSISKSCKQIIMIGDHKQLRPKINLYNLSVESGNGHDLNKSLFERLVSNDYPHVCLDTQHRMRPEISECVRLLTYPELKGTLAPRGNWLSRPTQ
ncbi:hypothetical protein ROZALSC1DRAFT_22345 [Rozella allomycis CSF55]|uniref:DNA2/NAM7 helicase helicase domain-containing protein n=1 Tax=Rozella allomycis (strain CSF55) TaxID=988480 RepID=A0A4P9YJ02_ROZAC|nr:hypothetical protein ROZALSC1DRAFT_22345 [Rozella allomycis CSF55]